VQDQGNPRLDMGRTIAGRKRDIATNNELTFQHPFLSSGTNACNVPRSVQESKTRCALKSSHNTSHIFSSSSGSSAMSKIIQWMLKSNYGLNASKLRSSGQVSSTRSQLSSSCSKTSAHDPFKWFMSS
jgi:hypothetical protein